MQSVSANKLFLQNKILSPQEVKSSQPENKINLEISQEDQLLFDALMSDTVDVHPFTADDVEQSLTTADADVCSYSVYTRPQLTDTLSAQHACLPLCTSTTTTTTTTQPGQQPLLMINDTQPSLLPGLYSQHTPALTAAYQLVSVHQPTTSVHQSVTGVHPVATDVQQQSAAMLYTQPSAIQPACTQPPTPQLLYT